jgi:hypothetical protein
MHYNVFGGVPGDLFHGPHADFNYPRCHSPPSRVEDADGRSAGMAEIDRHAIGHGHREAKSALAGYVSI